MHLEIDNEKLESLILVNPNIIEKKIIKKQEEII